MQGVAARGWAACAIAAIFLLSCHLQWGADQTPHANKVAVLRTDENGHNGETLESVRREDPVAVKPDGEWHAPFSHIVLAALDGCGFRARARLELGLENPLPYTSREPFRDVSVSVPLQSPVVPGAHGTEGDKRLVSLDLANLAQKHAQPDTFSLKSRVVYGIGIAKNSQFEEHRALAGYEVHGFDCTIGEKAGSVVGKHFHFHKWCIGNLNKTEATNMKVGWVFKTEGGDDNFGSMRTLKATMDELGHSVIDILKFDIEGFEWMLFEDILALPPDRRPMQLSFELHTQGANPGPVKKSLVAGKGHAAVNQLFLRLMDAGYGVVAGEVNVQDDYCAEFVVVRMDKQFKPADGRPVANRSLIDPKKILPGRVLPCKPWPCIC